MTDSWEIKNHSQNIKRTMNLPSHVFSSMVIDYEIEDQSSSPIYKDCMLF